MKINTIKLLLFFVLAFLSGNILLAQTWEHTYGIPGRYENTWGVSKSYDRGFVQATRVNDGALWLNKIDVNGNILWSKYYKHNYLNQHLYTMGMASHIQDGTLLLTGSSSQSDSWGSPVIFKINPCGEPEWCKIWQVIDGGYGVHVLNSGSGKIIIHTRYANNSPMNIYDRFQLAEFDANGNFLWSSQIMPYQEDPKIINYDMYSLIRTSDEGYLFGGYGYFRDTSDTDLFWLQNMMVKCDPYGNAEWVKAYFKQDDDEEFRGAIGSVFEYNGKYYAGGTRYQYYGNQVIASLPVLIKTDQTGNMLERFHMLDDSLVFSLPWAFDVINDSTIFMATRTTPILSQSVHIGMILTDTLGSIKKALDGYNGFLVEDCLARSDDGKYLLTGGNKIEDDYNAYALKVNSKLEWDTVYTGQFTYDSLCGHTIDSTVVICNCDITTGTIEPQHARENVSLIAYPNPATDHVAVLLPETKSSILIKVSDLFGRTVIEKKYSMGNTKAILNIQSLIDGYYLVTLTQNNSIVQNGNFLKKTLK